MDAAKLMWLMYEQPGTKFEEVAARFMVRTLAAPKLFIALACVCVHVCASLSVCR